MDVDRMENRNCYNCGGFRHLARNCRNKKIKDRIGKGRRLEYGDRQWLAIKGTNKQDFVEGDLITFG